MGTESGKKLGSEEVKKLIEGKGFETYLESKNINLTINTASPYPVSAADVKEAKEAAKKAVESAETMGINLDDEKTSSTQSGGRK